MASKAGGGGSGEGYAASHDRASIRDRRHALPAGSHDTGSAGTRTRAPAFAQLTSAGASAGSRAKRDSRSARRLLLGRGLVEALRGQPRARGGRGERGKHPAVALEPREQRRVDRRPARTGLGEGRRGGDQREVVLVAAARDPRAVLEVHLPDRRDHHAREHRRGERRERAERQQRAAQRLRAAGGGRMAPAGAQAELALEEAGRAVESVAAEPAEELLRSMADHQRPDRAAQEGSTEVHRHLSFGVVPSNTMSARWRRDLTTRTVTPLQRSRSAARAPAVSPAAAAHRQRCNHAERAQARRPPGRLGDPDVRGHHPAGGHSDARGADAHLAAAQLRRQRERAGGGAAFDLGGDRGRRRPSTASRGRRVCSPSA